jgi:hypothetical protein
MNEVSMFFQGKRLKSEIIRVKGSEARPRYMKSPRVFA